MTTEALDDKWAEKLAEVKVEMLVTLLPQIKAEALMNTLAARANRCGNRDTWRDWLA